MNKAVTILIIVIAVLAFLGAVFLIINDYIYQEKQGTGEVVEPYQATLTGVQVCLPHKDTTGPQTKECATGIKLDSGEYYVLDFALMSQTPPDIHSGERFTASGVITPIERLSTDQWQKYDVRGVFSVTSGVQIEEESVVAPTPSGKCYVGGCSSQLCTDQPNMASTCEYRNEYACYQNQICERQASGECGWTLNAEAVACLETTGN